MPELRRVGPLAGWRSEVRLACADHGVNDERWPIADQNPADPGLRADRHQRDEPRSPETLGTKCLRGSRAYEGVNW
jgi:hypothetical protein